MRDGGARGRGAGWGRWGDRPALSDNGGMHLVPDAAAYLAGRWHIERTVHDLRADTTGTFRGTADFIPDGPDGALRHAEEGVLTWQGVEHPATRTLWLRPRTDGTAAVTFEDGRPFHDLDLRSGRWTAVHPCAADHYEGTFTVLAADRWDLTWRVTGPHKDQLLRSVHRRAD